MADVDNRIDHARVDWDASAPRSISFGDIYFSESGLDETRHVFLDGNQLRRRFKTADRFTIGELGFGTGLNILAAWRLFSEIAPPAARLRFFSVEKHPLTRADHARALSAWPSLSTHSQKLLDAYPSASRGFHRIRLDDRTTLLLLIGDAQSLLSALNAQADAWFLDGFAPSKNPDMWSAPLFAEVARLSAENATLATFTVAGGVRRALADAGFAVEKREGFGRKREMLTGRLVRRPAPASSPEPWFRAAGDLRLSPGARVAVIGAGIAGASLAHELSAAGLNPILIERERVAAGASGNPAGIIMPRLDLGDGPTQRFHVAAYLDAVARLQSLPRLFNQGGVEQRAQSADDKDRLLRVAASGLLPPEHMTHDGHSVFFPKGGVVDPAAYCATLAGDTPVIRAAALRIRDAGERKRVDLDDGATVDADAVVIANGVDALRFAAARGLPLQRVDGQIDWFPGAPAIPNAIAFGPYAAPAPGGGVVIGATYEKAALPLCPAPSPVATRANLAAIAGALPELSAILENALSKPRAASRCQTPDRLPVAGPLPDWGFYGAAYDDLRLGRRRDFPSGEMARGAFIVTGLGSRGLVTAPLCAASIAATLTGAPDPLEREVGAALHPARFFIRDLRRGRIIAGGHGSDAL